jgi:hypothetical protein
MSQRWWKRACLAGLASLVRQDRGRCATRVHIAVLDEELLSQRLLGGLTPEQPIPLMGL